MQQRELRPRELGLTIAKVKVERCKHSGDRQVEIIGHDQKRRQSHITAFQDNADAIIAMKLRPGDKIRTHYNQADDEPCWCCGGHVCENAAVVRA